MAGSQGPGEGREHKLLTTEQVNSGKSAQAALGVSLSPDKLALVTLHGGGAGTGARCTCPVG